MPQKSSPDYFIKDFCWVQLRQNSLKCRPSIKRVTRIPRRL